MSSCFARFRAAATWLAIIDTDEFLALDPLQQWTGPTVMRELGRTPANATSVYVKMAWMDVERSGKLPASQLQAALPGLTLDDASAVAALRQTVAAMHYNYDAGLAYFQKAIHRTADVLSASVHTAGRTVAMGSVDGHSIDEFDPTVRRFAYTNLRIHRAFERGLYR